MLPLAAKILSTPLNVFVVYDDRLVEVELFTGGVIFRDPKDVGYYLNIFQYFLDHALTGTAATAFLRSVGDAFMRRRG